MVVGFGCLQLVLDLGERNDWFDSMLVLMCGVLAACMLAGFVIRELMADEPILDLTVFGDRNFALGTLAIFLVGLGFNSSLLLLALYTQTVLGYDAWTAGLTLAPGGLGTMIALMISGRLVSRMDQRLMLAGGCTLRRALSSSAPLTPTSTSGTSPGRASPVFFAVFIFVRSRPDAGHHPTERGQFEGAYTSRAIWRKPGGRGDDAPARGPVHRHATSPSTVELRDARGCACGPTIRDHGADTSLRRRPWPAVPRDGEQPISAYADDLALLLSILPSCF